MSAIVASSASSSLPSLLFKCHFCNLCPHFFQKLGKKSNGIGIISIDNRINTMASAVAVGEQQIRRRRHAAAAARSPLQALDTNRAGDSGDGSKEVFITPTAATNHIKTCANADDASVRTPKRASTTKRPSSSSHGASFFSPPRALREPIPFLSPTAPNYKDFAGTEDGTLPPLGILKFYHLTFVIHPLFVSFALLSPAPLPFSTQFVFCGIRA